MKTEQLILPHMRNKVTLNVLDDRYGLLEQIDAFILPEIEKSDDSAVFLYVLTNEALQEANSINVLDGTYKYIPPLSPTPSDLLMERAKNPQHYWTKKGLEDSYIVVGLTTYTTPDGQIYTRQGMSEMISPIIPATFAIRGERFIELLDSKDGDERVTNRDFVEFLNGILPRELGVEIQDN